MRKKSRSSKGASIGSVFAQGRCRTFLIPSNQCRLQNLSIKTILLLARPTAICLRIMGLSSLRPYFFLFLETYVIFKLMKHIFRTFDILKINTIFKSFFLNDRLLYLGEFLFYQPYNITSILFKIKYKSNSMK